MGNELKKSKKYYLYDIGIRNMIVKDFRPFKSRPDKGFLFESLVFLELNKQLDPYSESRFWRTKDGREVDYIYIHNRLLFPIEVKSDLSKDIIPRGLTAFLKRYPETQKAFVFSQNINKTLDFRGIPIQFMSFDKLPNFRELLPPI